jgi:anti-anti-sigma regulatory factor
MLRIEIADEGSTPVVLVAGRLLGSAADELAKACDRMDGPFTLDLAEVLSADAAGIGLLCALRRAGTELRGLSPYLRLLLDGER